MANETTIEVLRIPGTLFPRGPFDENASYKFLNFVESGGNGYVCLQPCTGIPVTNTAYWFKFVFKGDKGDAFTYADLTAEQKAELVRDATAAAQAAASSAQSAADDAAAALQKFNTIKAAIDALDPTSTEGSIQTLAAKQGLLEADLNALGQKLYDSVDDETVSEEITLTDYLRSGDLVGSFQRSESQAWKHNGNARSGYIPHAALEALLAEGYTKLKVTMPTAYQGLITFVKKIPESSLGTKTYAYLVENGYLCSVHDTYNKTCLVAKANATTLHEIPEDAYAVFFQYKSNDDGSTASNYLRKPSSVVATGKAIKGDIQKLQEAVEELEQKGVDDNSVTTPKIVDKAVTSEKISDDAIPEKLLKETTVMRSYNLLDITKVTQQRLNSNGQPFSTISDLSLTDFIEIPANGLVAESLNGNSSNGWASWATYDENYNMVSVGYDNDVYMLPYSASYKYARFVLNNTTVHRVVVEASHDYANIPTSLMGASASNYFAEEEIKYSNQNQRLNIDDCVPDLKPALSLCGSTSLVAEEASVTADTPVYLSNFPKKLKNCHTYNLKAFFSDFPTGSAIRIGNGRNEINGRTIEITATEIRFLRYVAGSTRAYVVDDSAAHGLTISGFVIVNVKSDYSNITASIVTSDGSFSKTSSLTAGYAIYVNYGTPYIEANIALTNVKFSAYSDRFKQPIWVVGASYTSMYVNRWTYQMIKTFGHDNFLISGNPGDSSDVAFLELEKLLNFGTPRFLMWGIGINDTPFLFKTYANRLEMLCAKNGIELIYTRVPTRCDIGNTEITYSKAEINDYVVNSGHRYVSLYDAVVNPSTGLWYDGMNDDGTHPTVKGAVAMAAQIITDFPEIAQ